MTLPEALLPDTQALSLDHVEIDMLNRCLTVHVTSPCPIATCPICEHATIRVHSRYTRTVADLPWADYTVRLQLQVRRFFCDTASCSRKIFTERLPTVLEPWARRTLRLMAAQQHVGHTIGGAPGARVSHKIHLPGSRDTILRQVRKRPLPEASTPRALGVDDWAKRKGHSYGTILVDLEQGRIVDLLEDRRADTLASWLKAHPGVEIISRDRAEAYADGATRGAPDAIQVADRWHLLKNLGETLERILTAYQAVLSEAFSSPALSQTDVNVIEDIPMPDLSVCSVNKAEEAQSNQSAHLSSKDQLQQQRRAQRLARYERVQDLHKKGLSISAIARQMGMDRKTVSRFASAATFPERRPRTATASILGPYKPYLQERMKDAMPQGVRLVEEIRSQGYSGGATIVYDYLRQLRSGQNGAQLTIKGNRSTSIRSIIWFILRDPASYEAEDLEQIEKLRSIHIAVDEAITLAQHFAAIIRDRQGSEALDNWLTHAGQSNKRAWQNFATSLRRDYDAVCAAVSLSWSNGPTEGHVNRLKCIKRQMYGRGHMDLLQRRLLYVA